LAATITVQLVQANNGNGLSTQEVGALLPGTSSQASTEAATTAGAGGLSISTATGTATESSSGASITGGTASVGSLAGGASLPNAPVCLVATLTGNNEVPPGATQGVGFVAISIDPSNNSVTIDTNVNGVTLPATAMYIYQGSAGQTGNVVIPADKAPDSTGQVTTVVQTVDPVLLSQIIADPSNYYFNVLTSDYSLGALRGQLEVYDPSEYPMVPAGPGSSSSNQSATESAITGTPGSAPGNGITGSTGTGKISGGGSLITDTPPALFPSTDTPGPASSSSATPAGS
jgi:hypothetical protein